MKFDERIYSYLTGEEFSRGLFIPISTEENSVIGRFEFLKIIVKGKKIIHLGCCDHLPMNEYKIANKTWLHAELNNSAFRCLGVDIDEVGLKIMKDKYGYRDLLCADMAETASPEILKEKWDYIIMGEIIEHLDNPVDFLTRLRNNYKQVIGTAIITVPNAFRLINNEYVKQHQELINSDHKYWFTPYTLGKILIRSNILPNEFYFAQESISKINWKGLIKPISFIKRLLRYHTIKKYPAYRDILIMTAKLQNNNIK